MLERRSIAAGLWITFFVRRRCDGAIHAMRFIVGPGGEEQRALRLIVEIVAERHAPQTVESQRAMIRSAQFALELGGGDVVGVDRTMAEIAYEDIVREGAERRGRHCDSPWRVQPAARREAAQEIPVRVEFIDDAKARPRSFVFFTFFAFGVSHKKMTVDVLNVERGKIFLQFGVGEIARQSYLGKGRIEHVDLVAHEIRRIDRIGDCARGDRKPFVDSARWWITRLRIALDGVRHIDRRGPACDQAVLRRKKERAASRGFAASCHGKATAPVEHDTGWLSMLAARRCGNGYDQGHRRWQWCQIAETVVQRCKPRPVIGNPNESVRVERDAPWIHEMRIKMRRRRDGGNEYDKSFTVTMDEQTHTFDSFECAIATLAPHCAHCDCAIIGHGVESEGAFYCCAHCAKKSGVAGLRDRADAASAPA